LCTTSQSQPAATGKTRKKSRNQIIFKLRKNPGMKRIFAAKNPGMKNFFRARKSRNENFSLRINKVPREMKAAPLLPGGLT
jgi:hypothetical protein